MHSVALLLALLQCTSHAWRVQSLIEQFQSQKLIESKEGIIRSKSSRDAGRTGARHPWEDFAQFLLTRRPEAAFQPTTGRPTAASQFSHCRACQFPSRSRPLYLRTKVGKERKRAVKKTPEQKTLDDIQEAMKTYQKKDDSDKDDSDKEEIVSSKEDGGSRRDTLSSLRDQAISVVFGCILGAGVVLRSPKRDDQKMKAELIQLKGVLKEQEAKLREREGFATSAGGSPKTKLNDKDALKETQQRLQETETRLRDTQAVWRSAVDAAATAEQDSKRKAAVILALAGFAAVEGFVLIRGKEAAEAAMKAMEAKELDNKATLEKAAAIVAEELEAVEEEKVAALEEAAADLQAATLSKEKALKEASVEATAKLEAAMKEVAAARAEAAEKKAALQEATAQIQEAQESAAKQVQAVEATKEAALKEATKRVKAAEASREATSENQALAVKVVKKSKYQKKPLASNRQLRSVKKAKEPDQLQAAAMTVMQDLVLKQAMQTAMKKADAAAEAKLAAASEKVTEAQAKAAEAEAALRKVTTQLKASKWLKESRHHQD